MKLITHSPKKENLIIILIATAISSVSGLVLMLLFSTYTLNSAPFPYFLWCVHYITVLGLLIYATKTKARLVITDTLCLAVLPFLIVLLIWTIMSVDFLFALFTICIPLGVFICILLKFYNAAKSITIAATFVLTALIAIPIFMGSSAFRRTNEIRLVENMDYEIINPLFYWDTTDTSTMKFLCEEYFPSASKDQILDGLCTAGNYVLQAYGVASYKHCVVIIDSSLDRDGKLMGTYNGRTGVIHIAESLLKDREELINSFFHELRHHYQSCFAGLCCPRSEDMPLSRCEILLNNIFYKKAEQNTFKAYASQPIEEDAIVIAEKQSAFFEIFLETISSEF